MSVGPDVMVILQCLLCKKSETIRDSTFRGRMGEGAGGERERGGRGGRGVQGRLTFHAVILPWMVSSNRGGEGAELSQVAGMGSRASSSPPSGRFWLKRLGTVIDMEGRAARTIAFTRNPRPATRKRSCRDCRENWAECLEDVVSVGEASQWNRRRSLLSRAFRTRRCLGGLRQQEAKHAATPFLRLDPDAAAVPFHNRPADGQSDPGSRKDLLGVQPLNGLKIFSRSAASMPMPLSRTANSHPASCVGGGHVHAWCLQPAELDRVADQILEQLSQLRGIARNGGQRVAAYLGTAVLDFGSQVRQSLLQHGRTGYRWERAVGCRAGQNSANRKSASPFAWRYPGSNGSLRGPPGQEIAASLLQIFGQTLIPRTGAAKSWDKALVKYFNS